MGTDPDEMAKGAANLAGMGYDMIDGNSARPGNERRRPARGGPLLGTGASGGAARRLRHDVLQHGQQVVHLVVRVLGPHGEA